MKIYKASDEAATHFKDWCKSRPNFDPDGPIYLKLKALPKDPTPEQLDAVFDGRRSRWSSCFCTECATHKDIVVDFGEVGDTGDNLMLCADCLQNAAILLKQENI